MSRARLLSGVDSSKPEALARPMSAPHPRLASHAAWGGDVGPLLERLDEAAGTAVARAEAWSAINSGSFELAGLAKMTAPLLDAVAVTLAAVLATAAVLLGGGRPVPARPVAAG